MSVLALLLNADPKKIEEKATKKMEIPRLSAALGAPFELELQPIDPELYSEIQESAVNLDKKGGLKSIDTYALSVRTCVEGIKDPSMKDKGLMKKFGAASPNDLVKSCSWLAKSVIFPRKSARSTDTRARTKRMK